MLGLWLAGKNKINHRNNGFLGSGLLTICCPFYTPHPVNIGQEHFHFLIYILWWCAMLDIKIIEQSCDCADVYQTSELQ
jgi:hypothetical protein